MVLADHELMVFPLSLDELFVPKPTERLTLPDLPLKMASRWPSELVREPFSTGGRLATGSLEMPLERLKP
jgi:hypothetical protein